MQCCGSGRLVRRLESALAEQAHAPARADVPNFVSVSAALPCKLVRLDGRVAHVVVLLEGKLFKVAIFLPHCIPAMAGNVDDLHKNISNSSNNSSNNNNNNNSMRRVTSSSLEPLIQQCLKQQQQRSASAPPPSDAPSAAAVPEQVVWLAKDNYRFVAGSCEADLFSDARCRKQDSVRQQLIDGGVLLQTQSPDDRMLVRINKTPRPVQGTESSLFSFA